MARTLEDLAQAAFAALDARVAVGSASGRIAASYRQRWRTHLAPRIGRRKLNDITKRTVLSLRDELRADGLQESSIGSVLVVLRSTFAFAREADFTTTDPFRGIRRGGDSEISPVEGAALTGHDEQTWWRNYVQPRRDAESRHGIVSRLTARGIGVRPEVDQS